jgi:uncharacterized membrane protein YphA (DoxX/SURF4 family)
MSQPTVAILLAARLLLAASLIPSAVRKIAHYRAFVAAVADYGVLPTNLSRLAGFAIPWTELLVGTALLAGLALPIVGGVSILLLASFTAAVAINVHRGRQINCNCYGIASTARIGWGTIGRNGLLLLVAGAATLLAASSSSQDWGLESWSVVQVLVANPVSTALPVLLLVGAGLLSITLVEWGVDDRSRAMSLTRTSQHDRS